MEEYSVKYQNRILLGDRPELRQSRVRRMIEYRGAIDSRTARTEWIEKNLPQLCVVVRIPIKPFGRCSAAPISLLARIVKAVYRNGPDDPETPLPVYPEEWT